MKRAVVLMTRPARLALEPSCSPMHGSTGATSRGPEGIIVGLAEEIG